jgi:hypothetical protein
MGKGFYAQKVKENTTKPHLKPLQKKEARLPVENLQISFTITP